MDQEIGIRSHPVKIPRWSGLVCIDKPTGITSHDAVVRVRRRLKDRGIGHMGTLDPGASGLLVLALGSATRCIGVWQGGQKTYEATVRFGRTTDSQDMDGKILEERPVSLDEATIRAATEAYVGDIEQLPPMVSALKVKGERLHRIAREGRTVERARRRVHVTSWEWLDFQLPEASFRVRCGGGTYVRTLAHDLGQALGSGACLSALRRLRSEPFDVDQAVALDDLDHLTHEEVFERAGQSLDAALECVPTVILEEGEAAEIGYGARPLLEVGERGVEPALIGMGARSIVIRDAEGHALAMGELLAEGDSGTHARVAPGLVFPWAVRHGRPREFE